MVEFYQGAASPLLVAAFATERAEAKRTAEGLEGQVSADVLRAALLARDTSVRQRTLDGRWALDNLSQLGQLDYWATTRIPPHLHLSINNSVYVDNDPILLQGSWLAYAAGISSAAVLAELSATAPWSDFSDLKLRYELSVGTHVGVDADPENLVGSPARDIRENGNMSWNLR